MDRVDKVTEEFDRTTPFSDNTFMVLRMHLLWKENCEPTLNGELKTKNFFKRTKYSDIWLHIDTRGTGA
jgi:hypothetical protein